MWALIEDDQITRLIRSELNVQVPGRSEPVGNLALLTLEERKKLGVYKVVEPETVDHRYYAASYARNEIDHVNAEVVQTNQVVAQPVARIAKYRIEELREKKKLMEKVPVPIVLTRPLDHVNKEVFFFPDKMLVARLALSSQIGVVHDYFEDVEGNIHRLVSYEIDRLAESVSTHLIQVNKAVYEVGKIIQQWPEDEADALIELELSDILKERYDDHAYRDTGDLMMMVREKFIEP